MQNFISASREQIAALCREHHVRRLSVFGSATRDDFDAGSSDVDIIIEFEDLPIEQYSDNKQSLRGRLAIQLERKVDLLTWKSLRNPVIRREVESTHVMLYAA